MNKKTKTLSLTMVLVSSLQIFSPSEVSATKFSMENKIQNELHRIKSFRPDLSNIISPFSSNNFEQYEFTELEELESKLKETIDNDNSNDLLNLFSKENLYERKDLSITIFYPNQNAPVKIPLLHYCALKGKIECFNTLLNLKYTNAEEQVKITEYSVGWNAMAFAVAFNHKEIINVLKDMDVKFVSNPGIWEAASITYRNEFLKELLELESKDLKNCFCAALFGAIRSNNLEGLKLILPKLNNLNDIHDALGLTPIHVATNEDLLEITKLIIENGADINSQSPLEYTPLHVATEKNSFELAKLLINKGANINAEDAHGNTPLHVTAKENNFEVAKLLIKEGANIEALDLCDRTPLYLAAKKNSFEVAKLLIKNNANVYAQVFLAGKTPLHIAAEKNSFEVAKLLIENEPNFTEIIDHFERTPLHIAAQKGSFDVAQLLISRGMNVNTIDHLGKVPLQYAAFECTNLNTSEKIIRLLIENNCSLNVQGPHGIPLIIQAVKNDFTNLVQLLIDKGIDVNEIYGYEQGPLYYAVERENIDLVILLLKAGAGGLIDTKDLLRLFSKITLEQIAEFIDLLELEDITIYDQLINYARLAGHADAPKKLNRNITKNIQ